MIISSFDIERIQLAAHIYEVVSDFITLHKRGVNYVGLCPFHEDETPSFCVSPTKNIYKCFSCGEGGTSIHFIMKHEQLSYEMALKYLAKKYGIEVKETEITWEQKQIKNDREAMFVLNSFAQKTFSDYLFNTEEGKFNGLSLLYERRFNENIIKKFQIGYAKLDYNSFSQIALKAGYNKKYLEKTGLIFLGKNHSTLDRFSGRIIFPIHSLSGKIVAFGGRILKNIKNKSKYINSPESDIYHKSNELYGIYLARQAIVQQNLCFLVEGYTDVISMHQAGIENVVASSGTALTTGQIRLIKRFTNHVVIIYDGDLAGIKATLRGINLLLKNGLYIKIVLLPEGEDPDSFIRKNQSATFLKNYIKIHAMDFIRFKIQLLLKDSENDIIKKIQVITEVVDTIKLIPEEIMRLMYIKECSTLLNVEERFLIKKISEKEQLNYSKTQIDLENNRSIVILEELPPIYEYEKEIMYYIVRYGNQYFSYGEKRKNVIHLIFSNLKEDGIEFQCPIYRKMLQEGYKEWGKRMEKFNSEEYFKYHSDIEISKTAFTILTDKHGYIELNEEKKSINGIYFAINNYRSVLLDEQIKEINKKIKEEKHFDKQKDLLQKQKNCQKRKQYVSKLLGNRTFSNL